MDLFSSTQSTSAQRALKLREILQRSFHLQDFRRGQLDILNSITQGHDTMAVMPTGGGKSLCYQIPAIYFNGLVIVVSPLIALMKDQVRLLRSLGLPSGCFYSGQTSIEKQMIFHEMKNQGPYVLYLSPERVQNPGFASWIQNRNIALFAIDEAHCLSQWGPEFRQDYHRLDLLRQLRPDVPILALTATATPLVLKDIIERMKLKNPDRHVYGFYRPNLYYQVEVCKNDETKMLFMKQALLQTPTGRVIIYCGTRKQCEELTKSLQSEFSGVSYYHAGLDPDDRSRIQKDYEEGKIRILAATNAFGMGIDHPDVRLVVHYQMPATIESFYQEMGRAGRDGAESTCLLLYSKKDKGLHSYFIRQSESTAQHIDQRWRALETISAFAEGGECRHAGILTYFRDTQRIQNCGHCDSCQPESIRRIQLPPLMKIIQTKLEKKLKTISQKQPTTTELLLKQKSLTKPKKVLNSFHEEPPSPQVELRMDLLKTWRKQYADERDIPAFMIFSNKTLRDLAEKAPRSLEELELVYGLGPHKIKHLGKEILQQLGTSD